MKRQQFATAFAWAVSAVTVAIAPSAAWAEPSVTLGVVGGLTGVSTESSDALEATTVDKKWGIGGSIFFDAPIAPMFSFGVGAIYLQRKFEIGSPSLRVEREVPTLFVPVEARVWLGNILYVGAGAFGALRTGDETNTILSGNTTLVTWDNDDRDVFEYGLDASVGMTLPFGGRTGFTVEGRYLHGLNDPYTGPYEEKIRDIAITAGIRIGL